MKGKLMEEEKDKVVEELITAEPVLERNNATIFPMGGCIPICEYEIYHEKLEIWKGKLVIPPKAKGAPDIVFFSRKYQPDINELDQIFVEMEIETSDLIGIPFILVPKEKMLFSYYGGSGILALPTKNLHLPKHRQ
jgi:hypothetical protein